MEKLVLSVNSTTICGFLDKEDVKAIFDIIKAINWTNSEVKAFEQLIQEWKFDNVSGMVFSAIVALPEAVFYLVFAFLLLHLL